jgi:hypothetical protein
VDRSLADRARPARDRLSSVAARRRVEGAAGVARARRAASPRAPARPCDRAVRRRPAAAGRGGAEQQIAEASCVRSSVFTPHGSRPAGPRPRSMCAAPASSPSGCGERRPSSGWPATARHSGSSCSPRSSPRLAPPDSVRNPASRPWCPGAWPDVASAGRRARPRAQPGAGLQRRRRGVAVAAAQQPVDPEPVPARCAGRSRRSRQRSRAAGGRP